jgi:ribosome-binding protein aMBF1 (putative translation factor)
MAIAHVGSGSLSVSATASAQAAAQVDAPRRAIDVHVGTRLIEKRRQRGLRVHDLANMIHQPIDRIAAYERGDTRINARHLIALSRLLGVNLEFFFHGF